MKSFENISRLVKEARLAHPGHLSQSDLSHKLGYKNGQFISNVERGLCSIPLKSLALFCEVLDIPKPKVVEVILKDTELTIEHYFEKSHAKKKAQNERSQSEDKPLAENCA